MVCRCNKVKDFFCKYLKCESISDPDLPSRYSKFLLIYGGLAVSIIAITILIFGVAILVDNFFDERMRTFQTQRELIKQSIDKSHARLKQRVEFYEMLWHFRNHKNTPVERYRQELIDNGVILVGKEITVAPAMVISSRRNISSKGEISDFLSLLREVSPTPSLRKKETGYYLEGYIYSPNRKLLSLFPPLSNSQLKIIREVGFDYFINELVDRVDSTLIVINKAKIRDDRVFWVPIYRSVITGELITNYAAPVYCGDDIIAIVVVTVPINDLSIIYSNMKFERGFFIASSDGEHILGSDHYSSIDIGWMKSKRNRLQFINNASYTPELNYHDGFFYISQRIQGPDWVAVYAFDIFTVLNGVKRGVIVGSGVAFLFILLQWGGILIINRLVLIPIRIQSHLIYESERFNQAVLSTAPVGLVVFEPHDKKIILQNEVAKDLTLSSQAAELYNDILDNKIGSNQSEGVKTLSGVNEVSMTEVTLVNDNGELIDISVAYSHVHYKQREVVLFSLNNISAQKNTARLMEHAREMAVQANHAKSMFIAMMSHEIRTPLHGALGNLELLGMELLTPDQNARVLTIRRSFDALLALINDILDLSKIESGGMELNNVPFQLVELIEGCAQTLSSLILEKKLRFFCLISPRLAGTWVGDKNRLTQVVMNILGNALKFTDKGAVTIRVIPREVIDNIHWVRISISDTGIGIKRDKLNEIFESFVQADRSISSRFGGTGLGLTLSKRIIGLMGGYINVDSEEGEGSIFTIDVPLQLNSSVAHKSMVSKVCLFSSIVIVCDAPLWNFNLTECIRLWWPEVEIIEASPLKPFSAYNKSTVIVFAISNIMQANLWEGVRSTYLDAIKISSCGPLHPERISHYFHVTSFSLSMFKLTLEACGHHQDIVQNLYSHPNVIIAKCNRAKLLIAEDDPINRTLLEHQLAALGYEDVDSACDGQQALYLCIKNNYDVIITDVGMPLMDGYLFIESIRAKGIYTPVIISTADSSEFLKNEALDISGFLHKPVTIEMLNSALDGILGKNTSNSTSVAGGKSARYIPKNMKDIFVSEWYRDEISLNDALMSADEKRFCAILHRLKGACLTMGERHMVVIIDELTLCVEKNGFISGRVKIDNFLAELIKLIRNYKLDLLAE